MALTWWNLLQLLGRSAPATAGILPRPASLPQLESMVSIPPQASVTASVTSPNDSMLMIVLVCLGFYMLSATISAAIGVIMHLSGRSLNTTTRGAGSWTAGGIMDTFDIMRLPLAYEIDEPAGSSSGRPQTVSYIPWDGPEPAYIPVNMVKVLQPGMLEAGLVVKQPLMQPDATDLSIISVTSSPGQQQLSDEMLQRLNGNGGSTNGNGKSNGRSNGNGRDH
uniref:Uncharacterized protein n=1 Tax=Tetradesmus obliquus TaxID=3088 RepID=A0A383V388_TETOB|eukprot:jgi/Sobl393_1/247/SZX60035.1